MKKHTARRKPTRYGKTLAVRFEKKKIKTKIQIFYHVHTKRHNSISREH